MANTSEIVIAEADSTTYPFSSPVRRSESVWSLETVAWNQLPDSTTSPPSSSSTTPDDLSENLLEGYRLDDIINWVNEHVGGNNDNDVEVEDGDVQPDDIEAMDIPPPPDGEENGVGINFNNV